MAYHKPIRSPFSLRGALSTEEVEDTRAVHRILLLLQSLDSSQPLVNGYSLHDQLMKTQCPSYWVSFFVGDPMQFAYITVAFGIPLYQLFIFCCGNQYRLNMLKMMGLGLLCCLIKEVVVIAIQATMTKDNNSCHHIDEVRIVSCFLFDTKINVNGTCYYVAEVDHRVLL